MIDFSHASFLDQFLSKKMFFRTPDPPNSVEAFPGAMKKRRSKRRKRRRRRRKEEGEG